MTQAKTEAIIEVMPHVSIASGEQDEIFDVAFAACTDPIQRFTIEVQNAVNQLLTKYNPEVSAADLITKGLVGSLAAVRIGALLRLEMPMVIVRLTILQLLEDDLRVSLTMLRDLETKEQAAQDHDQESPKQG